MTLEPVEEATSLDKLAYDKIKDAILTFHFLPNQALIEGELAEQLRISKTPVRDALMRLEKEELVTRVPFKGTYVSDVNNQDMADIYEIRSVLEGLAIRMAVNNLTDEDFARMDKLIEDHDKALKQKEVAVVSNINSEFHSIIIQKCPNARLRKYLYQLDDQLKRYRLLSIAQGVRLEKSIPEHKAILNALKERDALKAEEAMKDHLISAMKDLYTQDFTELEQLLLKNQ